MEVYIETFTHKKRSSVELFSLSIEPNQHLINKWFCLSLEWKSEHEAWKYAAEEIVDLLHVARKEGADSMSLQYFGLCSCFLGISVSSL